MSTNGDAEAVSRRRSGRTVRKPDIFGEEQEDSLLTSSSSKRKRARESNGDHQEDEDEDELDEPVTEDETDESEPDEEELKEQRKKKRTTTAVAKPAIKRTKTTNGASTTLAIRPAGESRPTSKTAKSSKARSRPSQMHATGLYAEVFGRDNTEEEAVASWLEILQKDNVTGIRDLVNFVLQCIGCDTRIDTSDIEDIDHVPERLGDILDEYASQKTSEYPLASKSKQYAGMKDILVTFFRAVIHALHNSGLLYEEVAIYDNIHVWVATMSAAGYRPFRHTATVMSLSMTTALCEVAKELENSMATSKDQISAEKKKKSTNKARVSKLQEESRQEEGRLEHINGLLRDAFDTVYVHRYRDVDEKIRVECVTALGDWISLYRSMFLDGQFLRYLGWVLSDTNAPTRLEVVRALKTLFKDRRNIGALRAFTDRFRDRMVEMGSRDTDTSVRAEAIELLDRLRNAELLKAEDIDIVGQLIFDNEMRVRKAVAKFFVSNIKDLYDSSVEEIDREQFVAALPSSQDADDFLDPCQAWIKFKCLAQTLVSHDRENEAGRSGERHQDVYGTEDTDSRYMLATQSIYPYMPELQEWETLAGYLLYDHSTINAEADSSNINLAVQGAYKLENGEDMVLLDVLHFSAKLALQQMLDSQNEKKGKKSGTSKQDSRKRQENAAQHLMLVIPQLLNKFGGIPEAAASILRLEQLLNVDLINDLQSGEGSYANILEDINKQFKSHNDRNVIAEASKAFRTARTYETSQEAVDTKVAEIWSESKESLNSMLQGQNVPTRGTLDRNVLQEIGNITSRLAQLAAVSDCTEVVESRLSMTRAKNAKTKGANSTLLELLTQITQRGVADEDTTEQFAILEDRLCESAMTILSLYFRWKIVDLRKAILDKDSRALATGSLTNLVMQRTSFTEAIQLVISTRQPLDQVRIGAVLTLLDLFTLFATVRYMKPTKGELDDDIRSNLNTLVTNIPADIMTFVMETHEKMEKCLAKKTRKRIELPLEERRKSKRRSGTASSDVDNNEENDIEKPPEDSDDEAENEDDSDDASSSDEEATGKLGREAKRQSSLIAERSLCELTSKIVLATIGGVITSDDKIKARLQLNRARLGKSYGQVIAYLDDKKVKKAKGKPVPDKEKEKSSTKKPEISKAIVVEEDEEEEEIEDDEEERENRGVEDGDAEDLRERELDDDIEDDEGERREREDVPVENDDEIMGD